MSDMLGRQAEEDMERALELGRTDAERAILLLQSVDGGLNASEHHNEVDAMVNKVFDLDGDWKNI